MSEAFFSDRFSTKRGSAKDGEPSGSRMSQNMRAVPWVDAAPGQQLEGGRVGVGHHVGLVDPGEALDGRSVEADSLA